MIEATNVFGRQDPGLDWQGYLDGRCYTCCRGRGPNETEDMYRKEVDKKMTEDEIMEIYKKQAKALHAQRKDVKERDVKRLRSQCFDDLLKSVGEDNPTMTKTQIRKEAFKLITTITYDIFECFSLPSRVEKAKAIFNRYAKNKDCEAEDSDAEFIVIDDGEFELEVQWFHEITTGYFCNNKDCSPKGQFYGFKTSWISTVDDDGSPHFMCPICGSPCHVRTTSAHGPQAWAAMQAHGLTRRRTRLCP